MDRAHFTVKHFFLLQNNTFHCEMQLFINTNKKVNKNHANSFTAETITLHFRTPYIHLLTNQ